MQCQPEERDIVAQQYAEWVEAFWNAVFDLQQAAQEIEDDENPV